MDVYLVIHLQNGISSKKLLPANLREYTSLTKDAVIIGVGTRIEIWDKKKWNEYNSEENLSVDSIAEKMTELGILGI